MIHSKGYDIEVLPNFFSVSIIDLSHYLKVFEDCVVLDRKGKPKPIPLVQCLTVEEIKARLATVNKVSFYITDTDDSQLFPMLAYFNSLAPHVDERHISHRTDMFGYNSIKYDRLMIAALLMLAPQANNTAELITKLYNTSKRIIELQDDRDNRNQDYFINNLKKYGLPYVNVDVMTIFALNKVGSGFDKVSGKKVYFPKGLKQTSINLQWHQLLEYDLPPIGEADYKLYWRNAQHKGLTPEHLNIMIDKWDRYIIPEWIPDTMYYNDNDVFIVCEMVRLYIDEVRLRYNVTKAYGVHVLSSSRSDISDKVFTKFYSQFSGLHPRQWAGRKTERTAMSFKRVIFDDIKFRTPAMQALLEDMRKVVVHSVSKDSFVREVVVGKVTYTIATGGLHSKDQPRELRSKCISIDPSSTGKVIPADSSWSNLTDDSYIYVHFDISSFYPRLIATRKICPAHLDEGVFVKLVMWLMTTRIEAKHSIHDIIDGIPKEVLADVFKIILNAMYGKFGYEYGDLFDKLAVLKTTINGQLLIMMVCEDLELADIEVASANTDGIVVKVYKRDKAKFDHVVDDWKKRTNLEADSEEYECYVNRDINNYVVREFNGKMVHKGALNPLMYAVDLSKGYDMPIVAKAVVDYFLDNKPVLETLYEATNILDFCKTQNVGKQYHIEHTLGMDVIKLQRNMRFYISNKGGYVHKVNNTIKNKVAKSALGGNQRVQILNTLDDKSIALRNINYIYYYEEAMKIINPIKLGISPTQKRNKDKKTASGKSLLKKYGGQFNTLFDDNNE